ncbi:MAG: MFS transporter [Deltaproteobacteria bacterium]|nr:MAG: MFS transporter [Deltaproteobacteria bacterium]
MIFYGVITVGSRLILLSQTQSLVMFYGSFLLIGFGTGGCTAVVPMPAVANWFHKNAGIALGVTASRIGASGLLVPLIARLTDVYGWRTTLVILGVGMWCLGVPLSFVIRNKPEQYGYLPYGKLSTDPITNVGIQGDGVEIGFTDALKNRSFLFLFMAVALRGMIISAVVLHVMPYLSTTGIPRSTAALVAAGIPLFSIIGRFGFGWLGDYFDKRYMLAWTFCIMGLGMLAFCYVHVGWAVFLFFLLFSPGHGGSMVLRASFLREYFGRDSFGKLIGITMGSQAIGGIIGPTLAGWVFDAFGSYQVIWLVFSGSMGLAIGLVLRIR